MKPETTNEIEVNTDEIPIENTDEIPLTADVKYFTQEHVDTLIDEGYSSLNLVAAMDPGTLEGMCETTTISAKRMINQAKKAIGQGGTNTETVMADITRHGPSSAKDIVDRTGLSSGGVYGAIYVLRESGLVETNDGMHSLASSTEIKDSEDGSENEALIVDVSTDINPNSSSSVATETALKSHVPEKSSSVEESAIQEKDCYPPLQLFMLGEGLVTSVEITGEMRGFEKGHSTSGNIDLTGMIHHTESPIGIVEHPEVVGVEAKISGRSAALKDALVTAQLGRSYLDKVYIAIPRPTSSSSKLTNLIIEECSRDGIGVILIDIPESLEEGSFEFTVRTQANRTPWRNPDRRNRFLTAVKDYLDSPANGDPYSWNRLTSGLNPDYRHVLE